MTLGVVEAGEFTKALINLEPGTDVYFRGPYGNPVIFPDDVKVVLVGGGSGFAAFYHMARDFKNVEVVVGARDKDHLFYIEETEKHAPVHIATEDGSSGTKGYVTEILKKFEKKEGEEIIFLNCGPPAMIKPVIEIEKKITDKIFSSIEYVTKCGVGLCGACSDRHGRRLCVDGPFLEEL
ncbi:MAG: hypothetical protein KKG59_06905 [Nanoarchaeota archaeon]|nr:hypothetical protein [Nanoarchaeota archaeon]